MSRDVPLSYGVDFELALERLHRDTGAAIRRLQTLRSENATPAAIEAARVEAAAAQARACELRVHDRAAIAQILAG